MAERYRWGDEDGETLRELVAKAPFQMAVIEGETMTVAHADSSLAELLGGEGGRDAIRGILGARWVEAIERVRETGEAFGGTRTVDGRLWDLRLERIASDRVGVYGRLLETNLRERELLHSLRNPIYGIRAAVRILLGREVRDETREVLGHIEAAADEAERCVRGLERVG